MAGRLVLRFMMITGMIGILTCVGTVMAQPLPEGANTRENLGREINSSFIEILPIVSPDGKTIYFDRKYSMDNVGGPSDEDDIYFSTLQEDGTWSEAQNIGKSLNTQWSDVLFWLSADGSEALVYNGALALDGKLGLGITQRKHGVWTKPERITVAGLDNLGSFYYAYISPDRKRLFIGYSSNPDNPIDLDIYVCKALSADLMQWGEPVALGPGVNTSYLEGAPYIASDNRTMYFTSTRDGGYGYSDLYVTRRVGESWLNWSEPINLGRSINTSRDDASISIPASGEYLYLSGSGSDGDVSYGKADIYRIKLPDSLRPDVSVLVDGELLGMAGGVTGLIRVERISDGKEVASTASNTEGGFTLILEPGEEYEVKGWSQGYSETSELIKIPDTPKERRSVTLRLKGDAPYDNRPLLFAKGSVAFSSEAVDRLNSIYMAVKPLLLSGGEIGVEIIGHTDSIGTEDSNQVLSERRAEEVRRRLRKLGVPDDMMVASGRGESDPVADNGTSQGQRLNRRVEIRVVTEGEIIRELLKDER